MSDIANKLAAPFSEGVIAELAKPLARAHVKERSQSGRKLSYIEGWMVIAEANRIFGFDGWTRETVMSECCYAGEYEKAIYSNGERTDRTTTSYRCTYRARVRVCVGGVVREGSGHGHGFADNPGEAHESAEKEAETDAMKRGLMTFGNQFGLALYDKEQAEVEPVARPQPRPPAGRPAPPRTPPTPFDEPPASNGHDDAEREASRKDYARLMVAFKAAPNIAAIVDPEIGLLAVNKAAIDRIRTYGGASTMAMLDKAAADRIVQLRGDKFEV